MVGNKNINGSGGTAVTVKEVLSSKKNKKSDLIVRNSFNHPRAYYTSRGASLTKQSNNGKKETSLP